MKIEKIGKYEVEILDSIEEMLIDRFHVYNKYLLIDSSIGATPEAIDGHIEKIIKYINYKDDKSATLELMNMRQALHFIYNSVSPEHLAFACLIKRIDGIECNDLTENGLREIVNKLKEGLTVGLIGNLLSFIKKKIEIELDLFFPDIFDNSRTKEYYLKLKERALKKLEGIIENKDNNKDIDEIDKNIFQMFKPKKFFGKDSEEILYQKKFEEMCLMISKNLNINAKSMTVIEFYSAFEMLKKENKPNKKHVK